MASGHGIVFAENMTYTHSVTADNADGSLAATIADSDDLSAFGVSGHPGTSKDAPVETAFTRDGRDAYTSNYSMYGSGFGPEEADACSRPGQYDNSFVYRIETKTFEIDEVIAVGSVPKYVAITPDDSEVLVTNWCTFDLSIIDTKTGKEFVRLPMGRHPRGIAVTPDGATAYVAIMGGNVILKVDLKTSRSRAWARRATRGATS